MVQNCGKIHGCHAFCCRAKEQYLWVHGFPALVLKLTQFYQNFRRNLMKKKLFICLFMLFIMTPQSAFCGETGFSLTGFAGGYFFDKAHNTESGPIGGFVLGYDFTSRFKAQLMTAYGNFEAGYYDKNKKCCQRHTDVDSFQFQVNGVYNITGNKIVTPYISVGMGGLFLFDDKDIAYKKSLMGNYGVGLNYHLTKSLDLCFELRHLINFNDYNSDFSGISGLTWHFGR